MSDFLLSLQLQSVMFNNVLKAFLKKIIILFPVYIFNCRLLFKKNVVDARNLALPVCEVRCVSYNCDNNYPSKFLSTYK